MDFLFLVFVQFDLFELCGARSVATRYGNSEATDSGSLHLLKLKVKSVVVVCIIFLRIKLSLTRKYAVRARILAPKRIEIISVRIRER